MHAQLLIDSKEAFEKKIQGSVLVYSYVDESLACPWHKFKSLKFQKWPKLVIILQLVSLH